jgi:hypothetical protein
LGLALTCLWLARALVSDPLALLVTLMGGYKQLQHSSADIRKIRQSRRQTCQALGSHQREQLQRSLARYSTACIKHFLGNA